MTEPTMASISPSDGITSWVPTALADGEKRLLRWLEEEDLPRTCKLDTLESLFNRGTRAGKSWRKITTYTITSQKLITKKRCVL